MFFERTGDVIAEKITISKEQAKIIATIVAPHIKAYIETYRAEYEEWLKEAKTAEIISTPQKIKLAKGA
jgi:hypothetical protein